MLPDFDNARRSWDFHRPLRPLYVAVPFNTVVPNLHSVNRAGGTQMETNATTDRTNVAHFLLCAFIAKLLPVVLCRILWVILSKLRFNRPNPDVTCKSPLRQSTVQN